MSKISTDDLLKIIGLKEAEIFSLKEQLARMADELMRLKSNADDKPK